MAVTSSLTHLARRIGSVIRSFAAGEGWNIANYSIAGTIDEQTGRFYLLVGSDRPLDEQRWHSEIMNALRREFVDRPSITSRIVLVVRNVSGIDQVSRDLIIGDGEIDITELF